MTCKAETTTSSTQFPLWLQRRRIPPPVPQAVLARKAKQKPATGYQPRAGKFAAVVPEYKSFYTVHATNDEAKQVKDIKANAGSKGWLTTDFRLHGGIIPRGARLVSMIEGGSGIGCRVQVGVPWSQEDFLEQAQKAEHPFSKHALLPDRVLTSLFDVLTWGPSEVSSSSWNTGRAERPNWRLTSRRCKRVCTKV